MSLWDDVTSSASFPFFIAHETINTFKLNDMIDEYKKNENQGNRSNGQFRTNAAGTYVV